MLPDMTDSTADSTDDMAAVRAVIAQTERAFNTHDPDLLVAPMADDVVTVGVNGARMMGRAAVLDAARAGFAGPLRDQYARYDVAHVSFPRPDVALVHKDATATDPDGTPVGVGHAMRALYVLVRGDDGWRIAARQNTLVPTP